MTALTAYAASYQHIPVTRATRLPADLLGPPVSTGRVAGVLSSIAAELDEFGILVNQGGTDGAGDAIR
ncbi:hypothetical protein [Amycolatopsis minnesotensis]|uniref:hypothetical protein n=1 Tax=Amycolatopsis minnesotensis TaxID=337894 RepID=UPI0031D420E3